MLNENPNLPDPTEIEPQSEPSPEPQPEPDQIPELPPSDPGELIEKDAGEE